MHHRSCKLVKQAKAVEDPLYYFPALLLLNVTGLPASVYKVFTLTPVDYVWHIGSNLLAPEKKLFPSAVKRVFG